MHGSVPAFRVIMLGMRGFPDVQGGVEKHAEKLCPLLHRMGCDVEVIVRARYMPRDRSEWHGVRFLRVWSPRSNSLETIVHTFLGVLIAAWKRPDVLHIHAVGPALFVPLARLFGLRVIVTHHGADYEREKWGRFAKLILRAGEAFGMRLANRRIAVSQVTTRIVEKKYHVDCTYIPNGIELPQIPTTVSVLTRLGLNPRKYVLMVGRLVPEKRQTDLIRAFGKAELKGWKLVLVGDSDHRGPYQQTIRRLAAEDPAVIMTGVQTGLALQELYAHAGLFVLPSSHEGLPIALLEALSYGLPVVASAIPANLEIGLDGRHYFAIGDIDALTERLKQFAGKLASPATRRSTRRSLAARQNWSSVAERTLRLYNQATATGSQGVGALGERGDKIA
ncbi:MAG TPA: glycosyltransferase family 4 protein [Xanthobacteraceae bacterium]|nr:glycosyltransferase family 4 protein [Xanthobacteraceae bacterium]